MFRAEGPAAVQLRRVRCQTPALMPLQRLPPGPGGAVQRLPLRALTIDLQRRLRLTEAGPGL